MRLTHHMLASIIFKINLLVALHRDKKTGEKGKKPLSPINATKGTVMEQLDFALQMERDGLKFFTEAAQAVQDSAAKKMLQSLAKDEERHEQILLDLKEGKMGQVQGETLEGVKTIFQDLVDTGDTLFKKEDSLSEVLKKGAELERRAIGVYRKLIESTDNPEVQKVWETLKREEKRHEKLLRLTLEYVDQPEIVLENAEFLFHGYEETP